MSLEILKNYKIKAKKSLGQNFLIDDDILNNISSEIKIFGENILEIGPGYGALTEKLLFGKPKSLYLVELDQEMIQILNQREQNHELITSGIDYKIINKDVLKYDVEFDDYNVIANIPYYITSPILHKFLYEVDKNPKKMIILMQKDVADKIMGERKKGKTQKSSVLSLFISKKSYVKSVCFVPSSSFFPAPKVDSEVLLFEIHNNYNNFDDKEFIKFIKIGFSNPRKKLLNNLSQGGYDKGKVLLVFGLLGFVEDIRGEDLDIENWLNLMEKLK